MEVTDKLKLQIYNVYEQLGIRPFMELPGVTEIVINEPGVIYYEENSVWQRHEVENKNSNTLIEGLQPHRAHSLQDRLQHGRIREAGAV